MLLDKLYLHPAIHRKCNGKFGLTRLPAINWFGNGNVAHHDKWTNAQHLDPIWAGNKRTIASVDNINPVIRGRNSFIAESYNTILLNKYGAMKLLAP